MLFNNKTQENDKSKKRITIYGYLYPSAGVTCLVRFDILWICCHKKLQKDLWLFRASPFASVCVGRYLESRLSDIPRHPQPRLPGGRLKSRKYKKSAVGGKKSPACAGKKKYLIVYLQAPYSWDNTSCCFFTAKGGLFFTATGRFLNHAGCCRHAKHGVGDGGDGKEENSFSDWRHRQPQKGEADNSRHGFLCLYQLIT